MSRRGFRPTRVERGRRVDFVLGRCPFADVASSFKQVASLVGTTTEAAREIEPRARTLGRALHSPSTAVVDPATNTYTEINEWGPVVRPEELEMLRDKLAYLSQGAEVVVLAGSLPRGLSEHLYAELIHELAQRHIPVVLDSDGEPLRYGVQAEPFLVSPNQAEAEALVGQEFHDDEDFLLGLDEIAAGKITYHRIPVEGEEEVPEEVTGL